MADSNVFLQFQFGDCEIDDMRKESDIQDHWNGQRNYKDVRCEDFFRKDKGAKMLNIIYSLPMGKNDLEKVNNVLDEMIDFGAHCFRFNLSKNQEEKFVVNYINTIVNTIKKRDQDVWIALDIPFPGRKARLWFGKERLDLCEGDTVRITSNKRKDNNDVCIDTSSIGKKVIVGDSLAVKDGICSWQVEDIISDDEIAVKAIANCKVYSGSSIGLFEKKYDSAMIDKYQKIISKIQPQAVIFSFIENKADVKACGEIAPDSKHIYKIETEKGIQEMHAFVDCNGDFMLGRGDLGLFSKPEHFADLQEQFVMTARMKGKRTYIATDIMESLVTRDYPSRADLIDADVIIRSNYDNVVLSCNMIFDRKYKKATKLLQSIEKNALSLKPYEL